MSSFGAQHPASEWLLAFLDGELPARKADEVRRHVEACWQCRAELEELQQAVADCVRYRKDFLANRLPEPPSAWADLSRGFAQVDAALKPAVRTAWLRPAALRWVAAAAMVIVAAGVLVHQFRETPSVKAAALLNRAVAAMDAQPARPRKIQVRTRNRQFTRTVGSAQVSLAEASAGPAVAAMFREALYDWSNPLSARSYREWRDALPAKTDDVATVAEGYRIRTVADDGPLESASLTLRNTDLRPVQGRFEFRNQEWVELTELTEASTSDDPFSAANEVELPSRRVVPSQPAAPSSGNSASISEELQVLAALHEIGADLGDPVEVGRSDGRVTVSGIGVPSPRQEEIRRALDSIPNVVVQFADPQVGTVPQDRQPVLPPPAPAKASTLQGRLERHLGGRAVFERFSTQMLDWNEAAMSRAYALRSLAQRFPAGAEAAMGPQERRVLADLARAHAGALEKQVASIQPELGPLLAALGGTAPQSAPAVAELPWQASAGELFREARRVEMLLSSLLGVASNEVSADRVPSELLTALSKLRARAEQCRARLARE